ncbi:MAG TPA: ATP-binding cassette domain-containing protein [Candidatus Agrococcus pullicola]|uniref:ATP-binding cassette domain-containing protein n=1 Tax=Candidatus Agrococcus pullicola TaxID=2838429 RepID=A0A9D1YVI8_9MICO|nr:ATP-binding cassette domain-containing protein [Candidatus Agrococcus pullicola]
MTGARIVAEGWGWRHASRRHPALDGVDFTIEPGERVLLLGPSGAGKSTLLAAMAGVLGGADEGDESGSLTIDGTRASELRGRAGLVLQDPQANTILSRIGDDVAFGCENLRVPREEIWHRVDGALDAVGLRYPLERSTTELSGGERQRLALAGVLAMQPGLLLLDEPTANLDPAGITEVRETVDRTVSASGTTLVVVEHRVEAWYDVIDRIIVLEPGGGVLADGAKDAVIGEHGDSLAARGVWIPGHPITIDRTPNPNGVLLTASGVAVGFGETVVQQGVDMAVRAGESLVITGENGAGKTTLAHALAGLTAPIAGSVNATDGFAPSRSPHPYRWRSRDLLTRIGTEFQQPEHQFVAASVREELTVGPRVAKLPGAGAIVDRLLESLRLSHLANAHPFTLSGGEQRRLSVATVLATAPRVLVLDEPTFGQDRTTWRELAVMIAEHVDAGGAAVSVTHDEQFIRLLGDARIHLEKLALHADVSQRGGL